MSRILIVDDEAAILGLLSKAFRCADYEVVTAQSGEQAIQFSEQQRFDAVLCDVTLPRLDGHQTVSRIRAKTPGAVSILMSGAHTTCTGACGTGRRTCIWLQKPFLPHVAVEIVGEALIRRSTNVGPISRVVWLE